MKKAKILFICFVAVGLVLASVGIRSISSAAPEAKVRKIVVFQDAVNEEAQNGLLKHFDFEDLRKLGLINGRAVILPVKAVNALSKRAEVKRIDDDVIVSALKKPTNPGKKPKDPQPDEVLPWGIDRIDAELVWGANTGAGIKVGIIDSGIDEDHPDLADNIKGGVNFVFKKGKVDPTKWDDDNGHGTHVAGIIGAIDNEIGVIGVGHEIDLYAVKVLDRRGSGYLSDVIAGLDWCIANDIDVINMSLGTNYDIESFEEAIKRVDEKGIVQVAAAGNDGPGDNTVDYPAKYAEVIAVSATDVNDNIASWSSRGPEVDLAAPGVSIYSTYKGSGYETLNGTSMASPHVAGVAALILDVNVGYTPSEVRQKLQDTADDLGTAGYDNLYGYGLVDAEEAVTGVETQ